MSILEVAAVLSILGVMLSAIIPGWLDRINRAKYEKMINEMTSMAQASIDFFNSQYPHAWPTSTGQLVPKYLYQAVSLNPWGNIYVPSYPNSSNNFNGLVTVTTTIPRGIAQKNPEGQLLNITPGATGGSDDTVSIALSVPNETSGRLQYEKKYTYN